MSTMGGEEEVLLLLVGDDWAEDHHDVEVQDATGRVLSKAKLPEGIIGIARLHALLGQHVRQALQPAQKIHKRTSRRECDATSRPERARRGLSETDDNGPGPA
jgi:hypothetical protein